MALRSRAREVPSTPRWRRPKLRATRSGNADRRPRTSRRPALDYARHEGTAGSHLSVVSRAVDPFHEGLVAEDCAQHGQARLDVEAGNVLWVGGGKRLPDQIFHGSGPLGRRCARRRRGHLLRPGRAAACPGPRLTQACERVLRPVQVGTLAAIRFTGGGWCLGRRFRRDVVGRDDLGGGGRGGDQAVQGAVGLHDDLAGTVHVPAQVVIEHGGQTARLEQFPVVCV